MTRDRAQRRSLAERTKRRVARYLADTHVAHIKPEDRPGHISKRVSREWQHRQRCSCPMCGNPRRHSKGEGKLTRQELEAYDRGASDDV